MKWQVYHVKAIFQHHSPDCYVIQASIFVTKFQEKLYHAEEASKEAPVSLLANDQCDQNKIAKCL